mgnify:CR=1 FL=1
MRREDIVYRAWWALFFGLLGYGYWLIFSQLL